jgi:hypothetical protein
MADNDSVLQRIDELFKEVQQLRELTELVAANSKTVVPIANIQPLKVAWKTLGYPSYEACWNKVDGGHYRSGKYGEALDRRKPGAKRADWFLNIDKCLARDCVEAGARR